MLQASNAFDKSKSYLPTLWLRVLHANIGHRPGILPKMAHGDLVGTAAVV